MAAKRAGRPPKSDNRRLNTQLNIRVKDDLLEMIDAKASELAKDYPEIEWNRGQVIRHMLYKAFETERVEDETT